jgi:8-oxo-dGTP diphosphatase
VAGDLYRPEPTDEEEFPDPSRFGYMPADWAPWQIIASNTFWPYAQHTPDMQAWIERTDREFEADHGMGTQFSPDFPPKMIVCVGSVVLRANKVLFARQSYGEMLKGRWTLPWGFVQGEDPSTYFDPPHVAALRETREEAGVVAEVEGLLGIQNARRSKEGDPRLYILFLCRHVSGEPIPDNQETDRAAYFSLEELKGIREDVDPFCYWLATRVLQGHYTLVPPEPENPYAPHLAFL